MCFVVYFCSLGIFVYWANRPLFSHRKLFSDLPLCWALGWVSTSKLFKSYFLVHYGLVGLMDISPEFGRGCFFLTICMPKFCFWSILSYKCYSNTLKEGNNQGIKKKQLWWSLHSYKVFTLKSIAIHRLCFWKLHSQVQRNARIQLWLFSP